MGGCCIVILVFEGVTYGYGRGRNAWGQVLLRVYLNCKNHPKGNHMRAQCKFVWVVQDRPLPVAKGVTTPINGLINGYSGLFHPYKWSYFILPVVTNWILGPSFAFKHCLRPGDTHHLCHRINQFCGGSLW